MATQLAPKAAAMKTRPNKPAAFSFFRSVSKEVYDRQNSQYVWNYGDIVSDSGVIIFCLRYSPTLMDGCTPIFVVDTDDIVDSLRKASLQHNNKNNNNSENDLKK